VKKTNKDIHDETFLAMCDVLDELKALKMSELNEFIKELTVLECMELFRALMLELGMSPVFDVDTGTGGGTTSPNVPEKDHYDVVLLGYGEYKVPVIKAVRQITTLGLKESKDLVESAPVTIMYRVTKEEALEYMSILVEAGGTVELR
jgi:large subunit ribosomal protein L7/L12